MSAGAAGRSFSLRIAGGLLAISLCAALLQARSYDLWWHLETGEQILALHRVPAVDDFSFTSAGHPWVNHEWLFQVILYASFAALGAGGLFLLKTLCALSAATVQLRALGGAGAGAGPAMAMVAVCLVGMRFRIGERPEIASLPLAALAAYLLLSLAQRPQRAVWRLAGLCVAVAVWANLHAGAILAPLMGLAVSAGVLGGLVLGRAREAGTLSGAAESPASLRNAAAATGLAGTCACLTPAGYRIYEVPLRIASALAPANLVNPEWLPPAWTDFPLYHLCAAALLVLGIVQVVRGDSGSLPRLTLLLLMTLLAWSSLRHVGVFFAVAPLSLTSSTLAHMSSFGRSRFWHVAPLAAIAWMLLAPPAGSRIGIGIQEGRFPVKAAEFIDRHLPTARLYNDVAFGGYLIWRGYPERRVFIDGRNEIHADLLHRLSESLDDGRRWQALLSDLDLDGAVLGYRSETIPVREAGTGASSTGTFSELHFPRPAWALVYWDDLAMIYVRRQGRFGRLAESREWATARPEAWKLGLEGVEGMLSGAGDTIVQDLQRKLRDDPDCSLAKSLIAVYGKEASTPKQ